MELLRVGFVLLLALCAGEIPTTYTADIRTTRRIDGFQLLYLAIYLITHKTFISLSAKTCLKATGLVLGTCYVSSSVAYDVFNRERSSF